MTLTRRTLHARALAVAGWLAVALGFSIPISTALDNILLAAIAIAWAVAAGAAPERIVVAVRHRPGALAALALYALLLAGSAYGPATADEAGRMLGKYADLLFVPVFLTALGDARLRRAALVAFAAGVGIDIALSYAAAAGLLQDFAPLRRAAELPFGFRLSITHGLLAALTVFLLALWAIQAQSRGARWALIALALVALHNTLFIGIGRTGYIVVAVLGLYFAALRLGGWRGIAVAIAVVAMALSGAYLASHRFAQRIDVALSELRGWQPGTATTESNSIGQRLEFGRNTAAIVAAHPVLGVGTGGFARAFEQQVGGTGMHPTAIPHNDYLLIAVQLGGAGLAALLVLYAALWREARRLPPELEGPLLRGLVLAIALGGVFNTLLMDHTEGLLFAWLAGLALAAGPTAARPVA